MMLTFKELYQEVGFWGAGAVASNEGMLAHLATMGITAALVPDVIHQWVSVSSLRLQVWSTWPAQHLIWHKELSPSTLMHTRW